jgi:hypothetical protein
MHGPQNIKLRYSRATVSNDSVSAVYRGAKKSLKLNK